MVLLGRDSVCAMSGHLRDDVRPAEAPIITMSMQNHSTRTGSGKGGAPSTNLKLKVENLVAPI